MIQSQHGTRSQSIESKLQSLLETDLPQVIPFLNAIGLSSSRGALQPPTSWNHDELRSIWYWFGVWDPALQLMEEIAINSWFKRWLFKRVVYRMRFLRPLFNSKYELYRSFDKSYNGMNELSLSAIRILFYFVLISLISESQFPSVFDVIKCYESITEMKLIYNQWHRGSFDISGSQSWCSKRIPLQQ